MTGALAKPHLPPGPWQDEPDRVEFEHAGLPCLMVRHPRMGHWCAYAAVPPGHPLHGKSYGEVKVDVHGGLTYSNRCSGDICHTPKPGEPEDVWWFGYDAAHMRDLAPGMRMIEERMGFSESFLNDVYRDAAYIRSETEGLAEQLAAMAGR